MEWIITCKVEGENSYDIFSAFSKYEEIDWKKSFNIEKDDIVYIYVGSPYKKIMYKTKCVKDNLTENERFEVDNFFKGDKDVYINQPHMRLKFIDVLDTEELSINEFNRLKLVKHNIQGPYKSDNNQKLFSYIKRVFDEHQEDIEYKEFNRPRVTTVEEWKKILKNEMNGRKQFDFVKQVLIKVYDKPNKTIFCKEFEKEINIRGLNLRVGEFRDRIKRIPDINIDEQIRDDTGTDRAWNIPFKTNKKVNDLPENKGKFCWILRDELRQAMEEMIPEIREIKKLKKVEDREENRYLDSLKKVEIKASKRFEYTNDIKQKPEKIILEDGVSYYKRNRMIALNALNHAQYMCEIDSSHKSFIRKNDGQRYSEAHHLIPMAYQDKFNFSLDVEENIVSLCSNCHNEIHYGINAKQLIEKLYNERKELLEKKNIGVSLEELLSYYGY